MAHLPLILALLLIRDVQSSRACYIHFRVDHHLVVCLRVSAQPRDLTLPSLANLVDLPIRHMVLVVLSTLLRIFRHRPLLDCALVQLGVLWHHSANAFASLHLLRLESIGGMMP